MCGICGILNSTGNLVDPNLLREMIGTIRYRGPDETGFYNHRHVGLGHARLSIIDLAGGSQPMHNAEKSLSITFNGEIFNYIELRDDLVKKGHRFATRSDTEVILHQYQEKGEDCVKDFNGQFAFAIWDAKKQKMILARDRLGVRPLFYTNSGDSFLFASEIKALFAHPGVRREIDLVGLDQIFTFWFTLPPRTIFQDIAELPPGCVLTVQNGEMKVRRYWELDYAPEPRTVRPESEHHYAERLLELLIDATRIRLRADVPVGAYLSGGLDSSVITALIRKFSDTPLKTFSVTFDDPEFDESAYQTEVTRHLRTDHCQVRCAREDIGRVFPEVIWHTEKPILRTAPAPLYILSRLVRDSGFKVVLTGEGSDEMLGGYDIFKEAKIRRFCGVRPDSRLRPLLLQKLYPYLPNLGLQSSAYRAAFFNTRPEDLSHPFFSHLPRWELTARLKLFFSDEVKSQLRSEARYAELAACLPLGYPHWDSFSQAQYLEAAYLLPGYILSSQGDRMAMAHSVEGRFPFLDHRVVRLASSLPSHLKMKVLNEKYLLKLCARGLVPARVTDRSKQPYRAPEAKSFFGRGNCDYVQGLLDPEHVRKGGLFNPVAVGKLAKKVLGSQSLGIKDNMAFVGILSTQLVIEQFIDHFGGVDFIASRQRETSPICG
jgi:asparagine synthase (glutamine-hydrolysing)